MQPPFHRLDEFVGFSPDDMAFVDYLRASSRRITRHTVIRREGDAVAGVFFLLEGWVHSSLLLRGGRRQIVKVHLPGDIVGVPSLALVAAGETLETLTDVSICLIPNALLGKMLGENPRLAVGLFLSTQKERVSLMHKLSWLGGASALERLIAFILDLHDRLDAAGLVTAGRFEVPLTQPELGEVLGLTSIHINRTLRKVAATGLVERGRGWFKITDLAALRNLAPNFRPHFAGEAAWLRLVGREPAR